MQRSGIGRASGPECLRGMSSRFSCVGGSEVGGGLARMDRQPSGPLMQLLHQSTMASSSSSPLMYARSPEAQNFECQLLMQREA